MYPCECGGLRTFKQQFKLRAKTLVGGKTQARKQCVKKIIKYVNSFRQDELFHWLLEGAVWEHFKMDYICQQKLLERLPNTLEPMSDTC